MNILVGINNRHRTTQIKLPALESWEHLVEFTFEEWRRALKRRRGLILGKRICLLLELIGETQILRIAQVAGIGFRGG